jgi:hypothetical protein
VSEAGARGNVWAVTAAALGVAAIAGLVTLTGPSTEADFHIPFTLAAVLGGSTFFAGLALVDRGSPRFGLAVRWLTTALWIVAVLCCPLVPTLERYGSGGVVLEVAQAGS